MRLIRKNKKDVRSIEYYPIKIFYSILPPAYRMEVPMYLTPRN